MDVELAVLECVLVDAELVDVPAHVGERDARRLLHHVAKLSGENEPVAAGAAGLHGGGLDEQDIAAGAGHSEPGGHARRCGTRG